jgi:hypothetical protein
MAEFDNWCYAVVKEHLGIEYIDQSTMAHHPDGSRKRLAERNKQYPELVDKYRPVRLIRLVEAETIETYPTQAQDALTSQEASTPGHMSMEEFITGEDPAPESPCADCFVDGICLGSPKDCPIGKEKRPQEAAV